MKVMEKFGVPEPQWILDRRDSGPLFWRRDTKENKSRVKFRCDVEVLEFSRGEHELEEIEWPQNLQTSSNLTMGMTLVMCIAITVLLPWYIIIGVN
ncbi:PREDICTED: uncharacterized protein LOC108569873 [Nicrophorus vespilloides]|uniref:Uncharacterized protein LOC108569873 n=1 Tax=Nicrophorus vespilloides TaxID=110193 RepID=A0ABM1NJU9_NICVS|nr:PREDICTED: uncharacterized protein LOC108569873 [Nicrophorus vespilloides]XP_017787099.1 PREDICTED: uncharacterized protein LOC108569873 [Nicrophorus vespilloides]XP_017787100.1 PREDICTED: uncharacterized protein LOC108569873 [Nicrophorus vespilloides]